MSSFVHVSPRSMLMQQRTRWCRHYQRQQQQQQQNFHYQTDPYRRRTRNLLLSSSRTSVPSVVVANITTTTTTKTMTKPSSLSTNTTKVVVSQRPQRRWNGSQNHQFSPSAQNTPYPLMALHLRAGGGEAFPTFATNALNISYPAIMPWISDQTRLGNFSNTRRRISFNQSSPLWLSSSQFHVQKKAALIQQQQQHQRRTNSSLSSPSPSSEKTQTFSTDDFSVGAVVIVRRSRGGEKVDEKGTITEPANAGGWFQITSTTTSEIFKARQSQVIEIVAKAETGLEAAGTVEPVEVATTTTTVEASDGSVSPPLEERREESAEYHSGESDRVADTLSSSGILGTSLATEDRTVERSQTIAMPWALKDGKETDQAVGSQYRVSDTASLDSSPPFESKEAEVENAESSARDSTVSGRLKVSLTKDNSSNDGSESDVPFFIFELDQSKVMAKDDIAVPSPKENAKSEKKSLKKNAKSEKDAIPDDVSVPSFKDYAEFGNTMQTSALQAFADTADSGVTSPTFSSWLSTSQPSLSTSQPSLSTSQPSLSTSQPSLSTSQPSLSTSQPPLSKRQKQPNVLPQEEPPVPISFKISDGPTTRFGLGNIATLTHASVLGTAGSTVVLSTVATAPLDSDSSSSVAESFLTVEYRQRHHAVGSIPFGLLRKDNAMLTKDETLSSRALDRSLRPLLLGRDDDHDDASTMEDPLHFHVNASVQACDVWAGDEAFGGGENSERTGHPLALSINSASAALYAKGHLTEPVAAVAMTYLPDGTLLVDPTPRHIHRHGMLLYSGTRNKTVMIEYFHGENMDDNSENNDETTIGIPHHIWPGMLALAHASIQPVMDSMEELKRTFETHSVQHPGQQQVSAPLSNQEEMNRVRASLGLPPLSSNVDEFHHVPSESVKSETNASLVEQAVEYCRERLGESILRLFGCGDKSCARANEGTGVLTAAIHRRGTRAADQLLSKVERGKRETIMQQEIGRLVNEFLQRHQNPANEYGEMSSVGGGTTQKSHFIQDQVSEQLLKRGMWEASYTYGQRADGRGKPGDGWKTIRPIEVRVPALPDTVHGSAFFARGDTRVLCTATLGPPMDGIPRYLNPFQPLTNPRNVPQKDESRQSRFSKLPVGSLRYLRTQEAMDADLNSNKIKAAQEQTGDSGNVADVQRFFLQYDFPPYSTGKVPVGSMAHKRRSVGHGALAERAILPVIPTTSQFPYAIRLTGEVTDSNGSSSMATVCGATLALLDAGVPIKEPVAGVSVGLALNGYETDEANTSHQLLLDITGTEDHYGGMDFKVAGTRGGVTALQLDVKEPLPLEVLIQALALAQVGRRAILDEMESQSMRSLGGLRARPELRDSAPRVEVVRFDPMRKRDLVGPSGVILRQMQARYGVSIDLSQEGQCLLYGANKDMVAKAKSVVMDLVADVVVGEVYIGTVIEISDFGAIVELMRNKEGLLHVSQIAADDEDIKGHPDGPAGFINSHLKVGQVLEVLCTEVDPIQGAVKLSRKALLERRGKQ